MNVHFFLEEQRIRLRKTQEEMAELGGVKLRTYANYASGDRVPDAAFLAAIAAAGADVQYILTGRPGVPAMSAEQERAGYVVQVLSPAEAAALEALRGSGALRALLGVDAQNGQIGRFDAPSAGQSAVITGDKNSVNQSQGGAHGKPGRKARGQNRG